MKLKVKIFDKSLMSEYVAVISVISLILSFVFIVLDVPDEYKCFVGFILVVVLSGIYIFLWMKSNTMKEAKITINNSKVHIKIDDLFNNNELKVIAFNEYFDTKVDNKVISENSLNGIFIKNKIQNQQDLMQLDNLIDSDEKLRQKLVEENTTRRTGKTKKYKLGTIYPYNDYLLTAFSKFDDENCAYLYMLDYIECLINFWNELDIVYAGRTVSIPLLGTGITRFKDYDMITEQELLELLIWTFKISRVKIKYPSQINIVIHEAIKDKINFFAILESQKFY